jgi:propionate CoA-transferase
MRTKTTSVEDAVAVVQTGDTLCTFGFVGIGTPDALLTELERRFIASGQPRDLTCFCCGAMRRQDRGLNALGHDGFLKRVVGGHWGLIPKISRLAVEGKIEAYNLPQGMARKTKYHPRAADKVKRHHERFPYKPRRVGN